MWKSEFVSSDDSSESSSDEKENIKNSDVEALDAVCYFSSECTDDETEDEILDNEEDETLDDEENEILDDQEDET
ncbi:hypothetical protein SNEBB_005168, partial [Seison nebaliae]